MGGRVQWDDPEQTILRFEFEGEWDWVVVRQVALMGQEMSASVEHRVDSVVDLRQSHGLPAHSLSQFEQLAQFPSPNSGVIVIVGGGNLVASLLNIFKRVYRSAAAKYHYVETMEEAERLIRRLRRELQ